MKHCLEHPPLATLRRVLMAMLVLGLTGTGVELLLLGHTEGWQRVPLALIACALVVLAWHGVARRRASLLTLRATMALFVVAGVAGLLLHYKGNVEFEKMFLPLNLNTATKEEILLIPGLGPRMLREFLEYRPYKALAQFRREMGKYVDDKEVARLERYVFVPIDLNTATDEDILSIPGLGPRMLREFKEYRPYKSIEQFRREMGKYVNAKEVARMERYVVIQ